MQSCKTVREELQTQIALYELNRHGFKVKFHPKEGSEQNINIYSTLSITEKRHTDDTSNASQKPYATIEFIFTG